jgi:AraC-like DNA-binding protein
LQAEEGRSVTDTALRWGFSHLGQFSASYRQRFGDLPSRTRALARGNAMGQAQLPAPSRVRKSD